MKVLENTPAEMSLGKLCDENGYSYEWINGQKPHLIKNGIRIQCNTENFVPIVVPGLLASSSSGSYQSTSRTLSRKESHCSTSSSSSSSSPTATSSDDETREREDRTKSDVSPVIVSTNVDHRTGQPVVNQANKIHKTNIKEPKIGRRETRCDLKSGSGCKNSEKISWMIEFLNAETHTAVLLVKCLWSPPSREVRIWVSTVFILTSLKTEIARSVRGLKLQGPRAEDAMAEPYFVLKIFVT